MTEGTPIPAGRCVCCGLKAVIQIDGRELCKFHYRLVHQDIDICIKYSQHIQKHRVEENLAKGDWQYE